MDSFIGEVHGYRKQGASFGYTKKRGYHPLLASRAETGEVLHVRLRKGAANTQRGILRFSEELIARVERAGATGVKLLRADSGFWNSKLFTRLEKAGWLYSIGVRMTQPVAEIVAAIPESDWTTIDDYPDSGEAQIAETLLGDRRLIVRRVRTLAAQSGAVPGLAALPVRDQPRRGHRGWSRPSTASTPSSSSASATSKTKRSSTSPRASSTPTPPGP